MKSSRTTESRTTHSGITRKLAELGAGVIGLALIAEMLLPRNNTAKVMEAVSTGFSTMVQAAIVGRAIENRLPEAVDRLFSLAEDDQLELLAELNDDDFAWIVEMSTNLS